MNPEMFLVINPVETNDQANIARHCIGELMKRILLLPIRADFGKILSSCDRKIAKDSTAILPREFAPGKKP
jgi:hypothetical protein